MNTSIIFEQYNVFVSLTDNDLFFNVINIELSKSYSNIVDIRNLKSPFDKEYTYYLILKCLKKERHHNLVISNIILNIQMNFTIIIDTIYEINFIILLNNNKNPPKNIEDIHSVIEKQQNDFQHVMKLYTDLTQIVEKQTIEIYNLKSIIDCIGDLEVKLYKTSTRSMMVTYSINTNEIQLLNAMESELLKIKMFYSLEKFSVELNGESIIFENRNLKHLVINGGKIKSLKGLVNLPLLEILEIINCSKLNDITEYLNNNIHLKKIYFIKSNDSHKPNLSIYCNKRGIELILQ